MIQIEFFKANKTKVEKKLFNLVNMDFPQK